MPVPSIAEGPSGRGRGSPLCFRAPMHPIVADCCEDLMKKSLSPGNVWAGWGFHHLPVTADAKGGQGITLAPPLGADSPPRPTAMWISCVHLE